MIVFFFRYNQEGFVMDYSKTIEELNEIAAQVKGKDKQSARDLQRVAQLLMPKIQDHGFDPSQEMDSDEGIDDMNFLKKNKEMYHKLNPNIESFVKVDENKSLGDNIKEHTCSVTFKADDSVKRQDMLNHILEIEDKLGVEVGAFKWSVSKDKGD